MSKKPLSAAGRRRKGAVGEREWANLWGGRRVARSGDPGIDVETPPLRLKRPLIRWEVKRRAKLPLVISAGLADLAKNDGDAIAIRADGGKWFVVLPAHALEIAHPLETFDECHEPGVPARDCYCRDIGTDREL